MGKMFLPFHEATVADTPLASVWNGTRRERTRHRQTPRKTAIGIGRQCRRSEVDQLEKFQPVSHEEFQRRRRKEDSPIKMLIQIVLGGW